MVEQLTLLLRVAFVVLLYVFVWRVVRTSVRDVRAPQESVVISAAAAAAMRASAGAPPERPRRGREPSAPAAVAHLVVVESPTFPAGTRIMLEEPVVVGRAADADAVLDGDPYASGRHARLVADGPRVIVEDLGSTNGTWVGGERVEGSRVAGPGDEVVIGGTRMRVEAT